MTSVILTNKAMARHIAYRRKERMEGDVSLEQGAGRRAKAANADASIEARITWVYDHHAYVLYHSSYKATQPSFLSMNVPLQTVGKSVTANANRSRLRGRRNRTID